MRSDPFLEILLRYFSPHLFLFNQNTSRHKRSIFIFFKFLYLPQSLYILDFVFVLYLSHQGFLFLHLNFQDIDLLVLFFHDQEFLKIKMRMKFLHSFVFQLLICPQLILNSFLQLFLSI